MEDSKYLLNGRFLIDLRVHGIKDTLAGVEHHLEPRILAVLIALVKNQGTLVSRETLIRDIWDDYAGAEEGLTQAISALRKLLADDAKDVIRTIPKKGYMLMAPVSKINNTTAVIKKSQRKMIYRIAAGLAIAISVVVFGFNRMKAPGAAADAKSTEVAFPGTDEADEINYLNTITTTDSAGNRYRLTMIGDRRPKFYVNDTLQPNTENYTKLVDKLAHELWRRQGEAESEKK